MLNFNKFFVLEACLIEPFEFQDLQFWKECILRLILEIKANNSITLFSINPLPTDICYEFSNFQKGKTSSIWYLSSILDTYNNELIKNVINSEEFLLGNSIIALGEFNPKKIEEIAIYWQRDLCLSGVEFLKMANDGLYFNWYNPDSIEKAENLTKSMLDTSFR